jgi:Dolichyl-phosphate-mannose-protein mannosyltransferase
LWKSGLEIVNIATSISSHRGFASPFAVPSGPTAWIPPVYPYFVAAVFSAFGPRSNLAAIFILISQAIFSALICVPLYSITREAIDEKTARWATWIWALFPYSVLVPVLFIWETALSALLFVVLYHLSMQLPDASSGRLLALGTLWGLAALTNTALLAALPFFFLWEYRHMAIKLWCRSALIVGCTLVLIVAPWGFRNWRTLKAIVPIRSNFGEELWLGNHEGGTGRIFFGISPSDNASEREKYCRMGELAYISQRKAEALRYIRDNPGTFINGSLYRFRYWWFAEGESAPVFFLYRLVTLFAAAGIVFAWRTRKSGAALLIITLFAYPLVYYLTDVYPRYRYPIEPFMVILGAFAASQIWRGVKTRFRTSP